jgi:hypothetical protein
MQEIELKFQIPPSEVDAVRAAVASAKASIEPLALQAAYFDTADSRLARHKMALRVRREGADWVQTFKAAGRDAMTRVEDNQPANAPLDGQLKPDLALHTAEGVRQALARAWALDKLGDATADALGLEAVYETRFERWSCQQPHPRGQVAVCVDIGEVQAGALREPLNELEIELTEGRAEAVIDTARHWVDQYGVWLDVQSKAYRGTRLAQADRSGQPVVAQPVAHTLGSWLAPNPPNDRLNPALILSAALDASAGNWSEVAAARPGWPEALHAWHDATASLLQLADKHAAIREALSAKVWEATRQMLSELAQLRQQGDPPDATSARALAHSASVTHWGLDLLAAIRR